MGRIFQIIEKLIYPVGLGIALASNFMWLWVFINQRRYDNFCVCEPSLSIGYIEIIMVIISILFLIHIAVSYHKYNALNVDN